MKIRGEIHCQSGFCSWQNMPQQGMITIQSHLLLWNIKKETVWDGEW